jgi:alginate O-acetyltransferase complex protein AlgI
MPEPLKNIFLYDEHNPLIFTRLYFWGFFLIVLTGYSFFYKKSSLRSAYLWIFSLFFYYKTGGLFFFILVFSTFADFGLGLLIYNAQTRLAKKLWLSLAVFVNIGVLAFFKYDYFFTENVNSIFHTNFEVIPHAAKWSNELFSTHFDLTKFLPPIGVSFFTFQSISYAMDIFRGQVKPLTNPVDYGFFVSFFPQLVAGPIVRASVFVPQIHKPYSLTAEEFGLAVYLILKGLIKKLLIGDYLAVNLVDRVFANPASYSGFENLAALFGYSVQVYCDFSGYTDIATGVALLLGFRLPQNFISPYKAKNVGEFWKRWHMSLSSWLKDYLYIPMGGNRGASPFTYISLLLFLVFVVMLTKIFILIPIFVFIIGNTWILSRFFPSIRLPIITNINLMMTMLIGGLWHGSSWTFVIWGGLNGVGLIAYKIWRKISPYENIDKWYINTWKILFTFTFITFTRIWFRSENLQGTMELLSQIANHFGSSAIPQMIVSYWKPLAMMAFGLIIHWMPETSKNAIRDWFSVRPMYQQIVISATIIFVIYQSVSSELTPFIYFQF